MIQQLQASVSVARVVEILVLCDFMMDVFGAAVAHLHIVFVKQLFEMPRVEVFLDKV